MAEQNGCWIWLPIWFGLLRTGLAAPCDCLFQGQVLASSIYTNYPTSNPGQHKNLAAISKYGTMCAPWDNVPGTPWFSSCDGTTASDAAKNWCQLPWCYVSSTCTGAVASSVFQGSTAAYYSYSTCGNAPDCYNNNAATGCPWDPNSDSGYTIYKQSCPCIYAGQSLPVTGLLDTYPSAKPGKYNGLTGIGTYGTTCAAWDQSPNTPWYSSCPKGADWCAYSYNWCQEPWCYVSSTCPTKIASSVFSGSTTAFYSYDTCKSTPDCYTKSSTKDKAQIAAACPFDKSDNGWYTAKTCSAFTVAKTTCTCLYQGKELPSATYTNYPTNDAGKWKTKTSVKKYGTMCAAWDSVPGTPYFDSSKSDPSVKADNWRFVPWCYVDPSCSTAISSSVFSGSSATKYSYAACGGAPDCYADNNAAGCPWDPNGDSGYTAYKSSCPCTYARSTLPSSIYTNYPTDSPGKYKNLGNIELYGTTCAAWDQSPNTPWFSSCPVGAEWCSTTFNWCQAPWCYVADTCATKVASSVFKGSNTSYYSYDTCQSTPDCYDSSSSTYASCPFDFMDNQWSTAKACALDGTWTPGECSCKFQGQSLASNIYNNYPASQQGKYKSLTAISKYGTMCAAWDNVPGTPWFSSCNNTDPSIPSKNWCQLPWCYVDSACGSGIASSVFSGSSVAKYSYAVCGAPDCYNNPSGAGCPWDPNGDSGYKIHKANCPCTYAGNFLPSTLLSQYPSASPGKYKSFKAIEIYGTACAAWDQSPNTPWHSYCPKGADWCAYSNNWCQEPWCYVGSTCSTKVPSSVFKGSSTAYYSYDTCKSTPDCYTNSATTKQAQLPASCPFDRRDNNWYTAKTCAAYTTKLTTCKCQYQGKELPFGTYTNYPTGADKGKYKSFASIRKYGTMCAAWDSVPGTPYFDESKNDPSVKKDNWRFVPWCYVDSSCPEAKRVSTSLWKGSTTQYYSYDVCGGAPNCYADPNAAGCPYDPNGDKGYTVYKNDCKCKFALTTLPSSLYTDYPTSSPGKYKGLLSINVYGTTCAAWDQSPNTPWFSYCPAGAEWCSKSFNWCQEPWCYVGDTCATKVASTVFAGSDTAYYSYDTCQSTPDCYTGSSNASKTMPTACPFDFRDNKWSTAKTCAVDGTWAPKQCTCRFQGSQLDSSIYNNYPYGQPGKYNATNAFAISKYGTMCAAWDNVPGTPWYDSCKDTDGSLPSKNWCQLPWCYVDSNCESGISSSVFNGSSVAKYSYAVCGAPDCYNTPTAPGCPHDPNADTSYAVYKKTCPCEYHGKALPSSLYNDYPSDKPGKYKSLTAISVYGTTCAAWDQSPDTPWYSSCPSGAEWCDYGKNWCQEPWCYVSSSCSSKVASSVFKGSTTAYYSYDTCRSTPDCYTNSGSKDKWGDLPATCPFDRYDNTWYTAKTCTDGWIDLAGAAAANQPIPASATPFFSIAFTLVGMDFDKFINDAASVRQLYSSTKNEVARRAAVSESLVDVYFTRGSVKIISNIRGNPSSISFNAAGYTSSIVAAAKALPNIATLSTGALSATGFTYGVEPLVANDGIRSAHLLIPAVLLGTLLLMV